MKFTIYTGFYEHVETFDMLVEGVFSQTYDNWEWIISDDFSTNNAVIEKMTALASSSPRVKIVKQSFKKEFYWNPPISRSTGDIFMVYDSDDMMHPKLLEVYKHNFEKFPDVQMISANSVIFTNGLSGPRRATRHINFGKNCNSFQSFRDTAYEYNWGDCRAWRNNVSTFCEPHKWKYCGDDVVKVTVLEEKGKILFLPRTLHIYNHREGSISHTVQDNVKISHETEEIFHEAHLRNDRHILNSIHDHYDRAFSQTTPFYLAGFNSKKTSCDINFLSTTINPRDMEILKDLYFDHDLKFNSQEVSDYLVVKLVTIEDLEKLRIFLSSKFPRKQLCVEASKSISDETEAYMNTLGFPWSWFKYTHFNGFIDL